MAMADVFTGAYSFTQPEVGGSVDTWGTKLNANWGAIDSILAQFVGMVAPFAATGTVPGWLKANGAEVSRTTYSRLWDFASNSGQVAATEGAKLLGEFGPGDGSTTFTLPDVRGYVVRAYDDGAGVDAGRVIGSVQADAMLAHSHTGTTAAGGGHTPTGTTAANGGHTPTGSISSGGNHSHSGSTNTTGNHRHSISSVSGGGNSNGLQYNSSNSDPTTKYTDYDGNHSHSLSINSGGTHSHSFTGDAVASHTHTFTGDAVADHTHTFTTSEVGGAEVRVKSVALAYYIRY